MTTGNDAARRPAGTPAGGQFAPVQHAEAEVDLPAVLSPDIYPGFDPDSDSETGKERPEWVDHRAWWVGNYNKSGSFAFPPKPLNALQVMDFWSNAAAPDVILAQFQAAYPAARKQQLNRWTNQAMASDPAPAQGMWGVTRKWTEENNAWKARWSAKWNEYARYVGPASMQPHEVRPAVLAIMAARDLHKLSPDTDESSPRTIHGAKSMSLGVCTVGEVERFYAAGEMPASVFRDPAMSVSSDMAQLRQTMTAMNNELAALRDGQDLDAATQGARTQKEYAQRARAAGFAPRR